MSASDHPSKPLFDYLFSIPRYRDGQYLDINALDHLDPVHARRAKHPQREFDYDGDMCRGHEDYLRNNGSGARRPTVVAGTFIQIADALPHIEAPSIVAEIPATNPLKTKEHNNGSKPIGSAAARDDASPHETE